MHASKHEATIQKNAVIDPEKRGFLKIAGLAGLGVIGALALPKKAKALVFGSTPASNTVGVKDENNVRITPAKETGGNLASIKTNTDNLAGIKTGTDNLAAIKTNTDKFTFTGNDLQVVSSDDPNAVGLKNSLDARVNPATDDAVVLLRRMVKLMESKATVDTVNRRRVTIDAWGSNVGGLIDTGTATGTQSSITLSDTGKVWLENAWSYHVVTIASGTGAGQYRLIANNTSTALVLADQWLTTPDGTSVYEIRTLISYMRDNGTASGAQTLLTLTDPTKSWTVNAWTNYVVKISNLSTTEGVRLIVSNTATTLTLAQQWTPTLDVATIADSGTVAGDQLYIINTLSDTSKAWSVNAWANFIVVITGGTGVGQMRSVISNTETILTVEWAWAIQPDTTSTYALYPFPAQNYTIHDLPFMMTDVGTSAGVPRIVSATDSTVATMTSVSDIVGIGSYSYQQIFADKAHEVYQDAIRQQLTFS